MSAASVDDLRHEGETADVLLRGRVVLLQARDGYRTSVDATLVAWWAAQCWRQLRQDEPLGCLDLGAGSGLIAILLGLHFQASQIRLVELQPALADRATRNLLLAGLDGRAVVSCGDVTDTTHATAADLVVCNPPFHPLVGRLLPASEERRVAHYESHLDLERAALAAARGLRDAGLFCLVFPHEPLRVEAALRAAGLADIVFRPVHHRANHTAPVRLLACAQRGATATRFEPPFALHPSDSDDARYSAELETFLANLPGPVAAECRPPATTSAVGPQARSLSDDVR